nr:hypothetical protein [Halomarina sp. BND7]
MIDLGQSLRNAALFQFPVDRSGDNEGVEGGQEVERIDLREMDERPASEAATSVTH